MNNPHFSDNTVDISEKADDDFVFENTTGIGMRFKAKKITPDIEESVLPTLESVRQIQTTVRVRKTSQFATIDIYTDNSW